MGMADGLGGNDRRSAGSGQKTARVEGKCLHPLGGHMGHSATAGGEVVYALQQQYEQPLGEADREGVYRGHHAAPAVEQRTECRARGHQVGVHRPLQRLVCHRCPQCQISAFRQEPRCDRCPRQDRNERRAGVRPPAVGTTGRHDQLRVGPGPPHGAHGFAHHLLYHARGDNRPHRFQYGFPRKPLVQHRGHRRVRPHGFGCGYHRQLHHRRQEQHRQPTQPVA